MTEPTKIMTDFAKKWMSIKEADKEYLYSPYDMADTIAQAIADYMANDKWNMCLQIKVNGAEYGELLYSHVHDNDKMFLPLMTIIGAFGVSWLGISMELAEGITRKELRDFLMSDETTWHIKCRTKLFGIATKSTLSLVKSTYKGALNDRL